MDTFIYDSLPQEFDPDLIIAGFWLHVDDEFLLVHRIPSKMGGGLWGNPGGKIEPGESILEAASRETKEETKLNIAPEKYKHIATVHGIYEGTQFTYHMCGTWLDKKPDISIDPIEHDDYKWVTYEQALGMDLVKTHPDCLGVYFAQLKKMNLL